jgi:hypothetical protein
MKSIQHATLAGANLTLGWESILEPAQTFADPSFEMLGTFIRQKISITLNTLALSSGRLSVHVSRRGKYPGLGLT